MSGNKELKPETEALLDLFFDLGDVKEVAEALDMSVGAVRKTLARHKDRLTEMTVERLSYLGAKAVGTYNKVLDDEHGMIAKADLKLKAADSVLDRIGASQKHQNTIEVSDTPIILMPAKAVQGEVIKVTKDES